jgi:hypothetical protein
VREQNESIETDLERLQRANQVLATSAYCASIRQAPVDRHRDTRLYYILEGRMSIWDNTGALDKLETNRELKRKYYGRLAFDCFRCMVKGNKAYCSKGHALGTAKDNTAPLISVLQGRTSTICRACTDYSGD